MPRPLIGAAAMTPAERQARRRERFRETMAENERLRALVERAQQCVSQQYEQWHADARDALAE